jgi:hypothetical protein
LNRGKFTIGSRNAVVVVGRQSSRLPALPFLIASEIGQNRANRLMVSDCHVSDYLRRKRLSQAFSGSPVSVAYRKLHYNKKIHNLTTKTLLFI